MRFTKFERGKWEEARCTVLEAVARAMKEENETPPVWLFSFAVSRGDSKKKKITGQGWNDRRASVQQAKFKQEATLILMRFCKKKKNVLHSALPNELSTLSKKNINEQRAK